MRSHSEKPVHQHCLQGIQLNSYRTFVGTACRRRVACVSTSPGAESSWSEEGVGPLIVSPECSGIAQQTEYTVRGLFVSSDQNISRMSLEIDVFLMNLCSWLHLHNAPKPFTNKRGWKLFTCK